MSDEKKCLKCGGSNVLLSELQSTGKLYVRPKHAKLRTVLTTGILVHGKVCVDCGHVELLVNAEKMKSIARAS